MAAYTVEQITAAGAALHAVDEITRLTRVAQGRAAVVGARWRTARDNAEQSYRTAVAGLSAVFGREFDAFYRVEVEQFCEHVLAGGQ